MNNISKKYELYLIKTETALKKTGIKTFTDDKVEYTIEILESFNPVTGEKVPMDLTECEITALAHRIESKTSVLQEYGTSSEKDGKIEIIDSLNGVFVFKPNKSIMSSPDKIQVQFTIKDIDEVICVQPILFVVLPTLDGVEGILPTNEINTLRQLEEQIEDSRELIELVKEESKATSVFVQGEIENLNLKIRGNDTLIQNQLDIFEGRIEDSKVLLNNKVAENTTIINNQLNMFTQKISQNTTTLENEIIVQSTRLDSELDVIDGRIADINTELNNTTSFIPMQNFLTPFVEEGSNYVSFKLSVADYEAKKLAGNVMLMNIAYESTNKQQGLSYSGLLTSVFYEDSKAIPYSYMYITPLYKPSISGMDIDPSVNFNGSINKLVATENYYEIWINTKIPKEELTNAKCVVTTFGAKIGVI